MYNLGMLTNTATLASSVVHAHAHDNKDHENDEDANQAGAYPRHERWEDGSEMKMSRSYYFHALALAWPHDLAQTEA